MFCFTRNQCMENGIMRCKTPSTSMTGSCRTSSTVPVMSTYGPSSSSSSVILPHIAYSASAELEFHLAILPIVRILNRVSHEALQRWSIHRLVRQRTLLRPTKQQDQVHLQSQCSLHDLAHELVHHGTKMAWNQANNKMRFVARYCRWKLMLRCPLTSAMMTLADIYRPRS